MTGTEMLPPLLVMAKLLFVVLVCNGFVENLGVPFLPFLPWLDGLRQAVGDELAYEYSLAFQAVFLLAGVLLWLNVRPRASCIVLGLSIILAMVGSKPLIRDYVFAAGCFLLLAGLTPPDRRPVLFYLQLSLIYLGAFLDKVLVVDWATGRFMDTFLADAFQNPVYLAVVDVLPRMWVARVLSWGAMITELAIGVGFLFSRTRAAAVWLGVLFHFGLYVFLLGITFGHFVQDMLLAFIAVIEWPQAAVTLAPRWGSAKAAKRILALVDWDRTFVVGPSGAAATPETDETSISLDRSGWGYVLRRSFGFYVGLLAAYQVVDAWAPEPVAFAVTTAVGVILIAFLAAPRPRMNGGR